MNTYHLLKLFQIVNKYIPDQDDSREFVTGVEAVIQNQLKMENTSLATKSELYQVRDELKRDIHLLKDELKTLEVRVETGFKDQLKWLILLMLGFSSLIITVIKLM